MTTNVVFITGCSDGGIGAALAQIFLERGCIVYATSRSVNSMSQLEHPNVRKMAVNVTDEESIITAVAQIYKETEGIDILVSNAGISDIGPFMDTPFVDGATVMDTNFFGFVRSAKAVLPRMAARGRGTIVSIGSILGEFGVPFQAYYNASKAALHSFTETLQMECIPLGISVMLVVPGSIKSNISANAMSNTYISNEDSYYTRYTAQIQRLLWSSQTDKAMDTLAFANVVVGKALLPQPPTYLTLGGLTTKWAILKWLPRPYVLSKLWQSVTRV